MMRPDLFELGSQQPLTHDPSRQLERSRAMRFKLELERDVVSLDTIRLLTYSDGIPNDDVAIRALVWMLLLNYLPVEREDWAQARETKKKIYFDFCSDLVIDSASLSRSIENHRTRRRAMSESTARGTTDGGGGEGQENGARLDHKPIAVDDHPLSTSDESQWKRFFADAETRDQILRDVERTHPDLHFFSGDSPECEARRASMLRALFVYAKLNPGISYVQGMNELFAVIFHTLSGDPEAEGDAVEAAAFWCFSDLLGEFRDNFCKQLDHSGVGIQATLSKLSASLRSFDRGLSVHLEKLGLAPQLYAFRWITTLLTHEFTFPDAVRLWDALLSDPDGRESCLLRLCLAMILLIGDDLKAKDFAGCMKLLQQYPPIDVGEVIRKAEQLKNFKTVIVLDDR